MCPRGTLPSEAPDEAPPMVPDHVLLTAPAAGADLVVPLAPLYLWRIESLTLLFTPDAAAPANRQVVLRVAEPDGTVWFESPPAAVIAAAAGATRVWFERGLRSVVAAGPLGVYAPLIAPLIPGGYQLIAHVDAMQATDTITAARMYVHKLTP